MNEVQAHSKGVEKLRLSHDCLNLFSVGMDGLICIFEVRDRDPRNQNKVKEELKFSPEILTLQTEMEKQLAECETLKQEEAALKDSENNLVENGIEKKK